MNKHPINTNKLRINLNIENLLTDFSIFEISTSELYIPYGSLILDEAISGLKALAVVFDKGNCFYCLFKDRDLNTNLISNTIKHWDGGSKLSIEKINSAEKIKKIPEHIISQLLLNSLSSPRNELLAFNNIL